MARGAHIWCGRQHAAASLTWAQVLCVAVRARHRPGTGRETGLVLQDPEAGAGAGAGSCEGAMRWRPAAERRRRSVSHLSFSVSASVTAAASSSHPSSSIVQFECGVIASNGRGSGWHPASAVHLTLLCCLCYTRDSAFVALLRQLWPAVSGSSLRPSPLFTSRAISPRAAPDEATGGLFWWQVARLPRLTPDHLCDTSTVRSADRDCVR